MIHRIQHYVRASRAARHRGAHIVGVPQTRDGDSVEQRADKLRTALQDGGPVYSSFALYLSSRIDLLPAEYCREFELTPDSAPALSPSGVERIMAGQLGAGFHRLFREFNFTPETIGLLSQTHAAVLLNGDAVSVLVLRPEYATLKGAHEIAGHLRQKSISELCPDIAAEEVIMDFLAALQRATDLHLRAQTMESMAVDPDATGARPACRVYGELSGKNVLTFAHTEETYADQVLRSAVLGRQTLARTLCLQWLQESLRGRFSPVDPRAGNLTMAEHLRFGFRGNEFIEFPRRTKDNLRCYLLATLVDDPELAARYLLQEMLPPQRGLKEAGEFRSKFRQAAYFGALEPVLGTDTNALAQLIYQHWKTALDHGYKPTPRLLCFYRGLFSVARVARKFAPAEDPLREGLEELDAIMAMDQFNDLAGTSYWSKNADKFAMAIINFPRAMDDALSRATAPESDTRPESSDGASRGRKAAARGMLLLAAIIFILQGDANTWMERSAVFALIMTGLIGLRALGD